jgi:hypothetical protein
MDVSGRNPTAEAGVYFRANVWAWHPIHDLIAELCQDLLDEEMLKNLAYNQGAGPTDAETCTEMANRFEAWMEHHTGGHGLDLGPRVTKEGRFVTDEELAENPDLETVSPYQVSDEHLKKWIDFLRHCGGFEVW